MEIAVSREYLASKAFPRDTRETFCSAILSSLIHTFCTHIIYTHFTHKWIGEPLRENPSKKTWELEIVIPSRNFKIGGLNKLLCFQHIFKF